MNNLMEKAQEAINQLPPWTEETGFLLSGLMLDVRAAGQASGRERMLAYLQRCVEADGKLSPAAGKSIAPQALAVCGQALFFALDETGDEKYRKALDEIFAWLEGDSLRDPAVFLGAAPFLVEYDTRFGGRQAYKAVARQFLAARESWLDEGKRLYGSPNARKDAVFSLRAEGRRLLSLADSAEQMDMQIYEHFRTLADLFLEGVKGLMPYRNPRTGLFSADILDPEGTIDPAGNGMTACALLKGVRLGLLDEEKYLPAAREMAKNLLTQDSDAAAGHPGLWLRLEAEMREVENR